MQDLVSQIKVEKQYAELYSKKSNPSAQKQKISNEEIFRYFVVLYVNYIQILKRLDECHDNIIQPQKLIDIGIVLEHVVSRVLEVKYQLIRLSQIFNDLSVVQQVRSDSSNKENIHDDSNKASKQIQNASDDSSKASSLDYVNLDRVLRDLKLQPHSLNLPIPRFFLEDGREDRSQRDSLIEGYMKLKLGISVIPFETHSEDRIEDNLPLENTSNISDDILRNSFVQKKRKKKFSFHGDDTEAAQFIQRVVRGAMSRYNTKNDQNEEKIFIGMKHSNDKEETDRVRSNLNNTYQLRKQEQESNRKSYDRSLTTLKNVILEEEGFDIREKLREERTFWITDQIAQTNNIPESLEGFYKKDQPPEEEAIENEENDKKGKEKKGKSSKKSSATEESDDEEEELIIWDSELTELISKDVESYENHWKCRVEPENNCQKHDVEMAKSRILRDQVQSELAVIIDGMLLSNLQKIKALKEDKKKKGKGKKGAKKKKGKKGKGKGKGKKEKPLPGAKIPELKNMDTDEMLSILIEHQIINNYQKELKMNDFVSDYLGASHLPAEGRVPTWINPSITQLRTLVTEYCIFPQGTKTIKSRLNENENIRSIVFYGPEGTGKTLMAEIVASELRALLINLSPEKLKGIFNDKTGPTKLIHMVFSVAKNLAYGPVVIYIGDCEQFFLPSGKKKKGPAVDKNGPIRFQKDLLTYKNRCLTKDDRVIIIGSTRNPDLADIKTFRWKGPTGKPEKQGFFERFLYFPLPSYADRIYLWKHFVHQKIKTWGGEGIVRQEYDGVILLKFNFSLLALLSANRSVGFIEEIVTKVLTFERVRTLKEKPLQESEFLVFLKCKMTEEQKEQTLASMNDAAIVKDEEEEVKEYLKRLHEFTYRIAELEVLNKTDDTGATTKGKGDGKAKKKPKK